MTGTRCSTLDERRLPVSGRVPVGRPGVTIDRVDGLVLEVAATLDGEERAGVAHRSRRFGAEQPLHDGIVVERQRSAPRPCRRGQRGWLAVLLVSCPWGEPATWARIRVRGPGPRPVHFRRAPRPDRRARGPRQGRQPGAGHGLHRGEGRRPAGRRRPARRSPRRDPRRQRRRRRRPPSRTVGRRRWSTGCGSPMPGSMAMANGLRAVAALPDPVGEVADGWMRPNGLRVQRVRVPLGVVAIIYENRPNVTSDAFGLCLKSGNAAFLRGSSGAIRSNIAIAAALREGLAKAGLPARRARARRGHPPRGGGRVHAPARLRRRADPSGWAVADPLRSSTTPRCRTSSTATATATCTSTPAPTSTWRPPSSRTPRPSGRRCATRPRRCSSTQRRRDLPPGPRPDGWRASSSWATTPLARSSATGSPPLATDDDYATEFLDLKLAVRVVDTLDAAIDHITRYGTGHSEAIVTTTSAPPIASSARSTPPPCS